MMGRGRMRWGALSSMAYELQPVFLFWLKYRLRPSVNFLLLLYNTLFIGEARVKFFFSHFDKFILGYFDPINIFFDSKNK